MYKLLTAICLLTIFSVGAFAQMQKQTDFGGKRKNPFDNASKQETETPGSTTIIEQYRKNEFYVGYSNQQVDTFGRTTFHGIQGAYVRNVHRWLGIRADVSYARDNATLRGNLPNPAGGTYDFQQDLNRSVANFLGGVQFKDNLSTKRFKPFGYALAGVAVSQTKLKNLFCTTPTCPTTIPIINNATFTEKNFAGAIGGGLDIRITDRIDFRAIQADYNPVFTNGTVRDNFRFGIGFVFK